MSGNTPSNSRAWIGRRVLVLLCSLFAASALAQTNLPINYNAAAGILPDDFTNNFFNWYDAGGYSQAFEAASGGILYMVQKGYFEHFQGNLDFSSSTNAYVLDANLYVVRSDYTVVAGLQRSGHYFEAYDSVGNGFELGISSGGVTLNTDAAGAVGQGIPFTPFNSTDGFHHYQVVLRGGQASLFIDGRPFGRAALVTSEPLGPELGFGDLAGALGTESGAAELRTLSLTNALFVPAVSVSSATNCAGEASVLTATTTAINPSFRWSPGGATNASIIVNPPATTTYTVTVTDGPTGFTNSAAGTVVVNPLPSVSVSSTASCAGSPVQLTATTSAMNPSYLWSPGGATTAAIVVNPVTNATYSVVVTDGSTGCANTASGTAIVVPPPTVSVNSSTVCPGNPAVLTATTSAVNPTYFWMPGGMTTASITVWPTATTTYTVSVIDGTTGCTGTGAGAVTVILPPIVNSVAACAGDPVALTAMTYAQNPSYLWSPGGATNASITVNPASTTTYNVTVTDGIQGCSMNGSGTVSVKTPDGVAFVYGDSVDQGYLVASTNSFAALICAALGLTDDNLAIGGSQIADWGESDAVTASTIYPTNRSLWLAGFNDMRFYGTNAAALADNAAAFQSLVAWLALPTSMRIQATDPRITYAGSWPFKPFLGGLTYSQAAGATATFAVAGKNILIGTARGGNAGNLIAVVDGSVTNVFSCLRTAADTALGRDYSAGLIIFTNLPDTMHTVVLTAQTAANTFFCWAAGYSGDPGPVVALCGTEKCAPFVYAWDVPFNQGSDAAADAYSDMVSNTAVLLSSAGLDVVWTSAPVFDTNTDYEPDFLHPNAAGHALIAAKMLPLLSGVSVLSPPLSATQYAGGTVTFAVAAAGKNLNYQWQANTGGGFANVTTGTGATAASYTTAPLALSNSETQYQCVLTAGCGPPVASAAALLTVVAPPPQGILFAPSLSGAGPALQIKLVGSPDAGYVLDWTHSLTPPILWLPLATNTADDNGWVFYTNAPSGCAADFYRARSWP